MSIRTGQLTLLAILFFVAMILTSGSCKDKVVSDNNDTSNNACLWINTFTITGGTVNVDAGGSYQFYVSIKNDGPAVCNQVVIRYFISTDSIINTADTYLNLEHTFDIAVKQDQSTYMQLTIPAWAVKGQTYWVGALIMSSSCGNTCEKYKAWQIKIKDGIITTTIPSTTVTTTTSKITSTVPPSSTIDSSSTTSSTTSTTSSTTTSTTSSTTSSVTVPPTNACLWIPNWHMKTPVFDGHEINCGSTYGFEREIKNDGPATCNNITIRYYLSTNSTITTSDTYLNYEETINLSPGNNSWKTVSLKMPSSLTDGNTYYVGILIISSSCINTCPKSGAWDVTASCPTTTTSTTITTTTICNKAMQTTVWKPREKTYEDGKIEPGEPVLVRHDLKNNSTCNLYNVRTVAECDSNCTYVTAVTNYHDWGTFTMGQERFCLDAYQFIINNACPHGTQIRYRIHYYDNTNNYLGTHYNQYIDVQ